MAKKTIQALWAQNTTNRLSFGEPEVESGIEYKGAVVSNQLNGIAYDAWGYIDNLQKGMTAWNPLKTYNAGDGAVVILNYNGSNEFINVVALKTTKNQPLKKAAAATTFSLDSANNMCVYTIEDDSSISILDYINTSDWKLVSDAYAKKLERDLQPQLEAIKKLVEDEKTRAMNYEAYLLDLIKQLQNTPSQSAIPIHSIAQAVQAGSTVSYPAGTLLEFTASKDLTTGGDCYIFFVTLNSAQTWNNLNVEMLQIGGTTSTKYYLSDWVNSNHLQGFEYPVDLTLLRGFGTDASFFYGLGQYLASSV